MSDRKSTEGHRPSVDRAALPIGVRAAARRAAVCLGLAAFVAACAPERPGRQQMVMPDFQLDRQRSGMAALLIGVDALDARHAWVSGVGGTFAWTNDGGQNWTVGVVPGADSLQFRDVHANSLDEAFLLSIGPDDDSRIYHTVDRGRTWEAQFVGDREETFFDCFAFWDDDGGLAFSDAVDGQFPMIRTTDRGASWTYLENTPAARDNEGGFAASGTCVTVIGDQTVLVGTGNSEVARVLRSEDRGLTWQSYDVPIDGGEASGIVSLAFRDEQHGVALGGNVMDAAAESDNAAATSDGGRTWTRRSRPPYTGAVYGSAYTTDGRVLVAVGPGGAAYSGDDARSWVMLDSLNHWSVDFGDSKSGWMVGPGGRITRISIPSID